MDTPHPYRGRIERVQRRLADQGLDAFLDLAAVDVAYLTGFFYNQTERPAGILVPRSGEPVLLLPVLDIDQARAESWVRHVETYFEFPGVQHPVAWMGEQLARLGFAGGAIGIDDGAWPAATSRRFREALPKARIHDAGPLVANFRQLKDTDELALVRQAARYANLTQEVGLAELRDRRVTTELELLNHIQGTVSARMATELPEIVGVKGLVAGTVVSGPRTAFPHGMTSQRRLRSGELVMLSFGCAVGGYRAENTRTYFLGRPPGEIAELYRVVEKTQALGRRLVAPGVVTRDVNSACLAALRAAGCDAFIRHRVGHGIGLEGHEPPWLEDGDHTVLAPGMVVSMEPGLYDPARGGCLISDTVEVRSDGAASLTDSARAWADVVVPW